MARFTQVFFLCVMMYSSQAAANCISTITPSPLPLGEDAVFQCCYERAIVIGYTLNGTGLPDPAYPNASIGPLVITNGVVCQNITIPIRLGYNMSQLVCEVRVPDMADPVSCGSENIITQGNVLTSNTTDNTTGNATGNTTSNTTNDPANDPANGKDWRNVGIIAGTVASVLLVCIAGHIPLAVCGLAVCGLLYKRKKTRVYVVTETGLKSQMEPGRTIRPNLDANSQMEPGKTINRRPPRPLRNADLSRQYAKSQRMETQIAESTFSKTMPEGNSPRSQPDLRVDDSQEENFCGDQKLSKETDATSPRDRAEGAMVLSPRTYVLTKGQLAAELVTQEQLCS